MYDPEEACNENDESKGEATAEENDDVEMIEEEEVKEKVEVKEDPKPQVTSTPVRQNKAKRGRK